MRTGILVAIVLWAFPGSTSRAGQAVSNREVAAGVPKEYQALYQGGVPSDQASDVWAGLPYDRIELERTGCFGVCPVYRLTLIRGGHAELHRIQNIEPIGDFGGTISIFDYGKLCLLMKKSGFDELPARYTAGWTDSPTFIVTAVSGHTTKVVSDYAGVGPVELWAVQQTPDAIAQRLRWTKVAGVENKPPR